MGFTPEQIKGRIKSVAKQNNADARTLMRIYMMERFLERLAQSEYRDNFIIKGGILVTAMIGVAHRSTMDIDTSMKNLNLSAEDALRVVNQVKDIDLDDGVSFEVKDVSNIMDEMEYAGIRNLFCGDAWAENIPGGKYDLVKLPHHGSIRNISDALLSRIQADTFLICADGTSHPNKQTIAKLLQQYGNISMLRSQNCRKTRRCSKKVFPRLSPTLKS